MEEINGLVNKHDEMISRLNTAISSLISLRGSGGITEVSPEFDSAFKELHEARNDFKEIERAMAIQLKEFLISRA